MHPLFSVFSRVGRTHRDHGRTSRDLLQLLKIAAPRYGHAVGDEVLRVIGRRLAQHLADAEVVARVGGDEFVVVLSGVDQAGSALLLQRIEQGCPDVSAGPVNLALGIRPCHDYHLDLLA